MENFQGTITTTGKSEAIRLDKALFRLHPEFQQKAKVKVQVISHGHALISIVDNQIDELEEDDPMIGAFLNFIEKDLVDHPDRPTQLTKQSLAKATRLVRNTKVKDDDSIPEDVTL